MKTSAAIALFMAIAMAAPQQARSTASSIDVAHSKLTVHVYKQGLFSFLGDNHEIDAPITAGSYDGSAQSVVLTVDATKMKVLDPKLSADKRNTVQSNMVGPQVLDVAKYPTISFQSTSISSADPNRWTITGNLTLHGQTHPVTFQAKRIDPTHFSGSATIRQTAFGITPIKIAGGAVSVKDDVNVEFDVALTS